jgi:hypothetical protein
MRGVGVIFIPMKRLIRSIERFQGPIEIAADKGNLGFGGDAAGASDRFSRAKGGGGAPQEQPCSGEIAKLGHGNAAQCQCRRVIA